MNGGRTLITGGAGFIGLNLVRCIASRGLATRCYDNFSAGSRRDAEAAGYDEIIDGDILDRDTLADAASGCDFLVHLAAQVGVPSSIADPVSDSELNVSGTLNALLAARDAKIQGFVLASSNAALGDVEPPAHERLVPAPISPYGASKLAAEAYCSAFAAAYDVPTMVLRFANVYGPHSEHTGSAIALWCRRLIAGEPLVVFGDGTQTRDFTYVGDLCEGVVAAMLSGGHGVVAHLGTGVEVKVVDAARAVLAHARGRSPGIEFRPARPGDIVRDYADISSARDLFGYRPTTMLDEGLARTVSWFEQRASAP